ncbi:GNAT family N-acetyltransferase [Streptacidiphilus sp. P02-A3a]|uniref:GNAT family N-acetyltransferase n=1 Tax=Streptacidiphilus sp. P02-A3a TaxID=2704468 RepID=UPI0015FD05A1|nr:GNAT family protein [Streptacidiphilus sp. P02-A3a]QMU72557.1 GNAT family N-acetyltransferase [Streptacidiphilus sp. P02-A3a]
MSEPQRAPSGPDFLSKPTLVGDLVTLRCVTADDLPVLRALWEDPESSRLTGSHPRPNADESKVYAWYATRVGQDDRLDLAVLDNADGAVVGEVVLNDWSPANESCGFRIALVPGHYGRGLGTEATRLLCGYGFEKLGLHRISLEVYAFNPRARRAYEKAGFVAEGVLRDALRWREERVDATVMSILAPEWERHGGHPATA